MNTNTPTKVLPPWMIKEGMSITKEQRGETKEEIKTDGNSTAPELSDDKKSTTVNDEEKNIQVCPLLKLVLLFFSSYIL